MARQRNSEQKAMAGRNNGHIPSLGYMEPIETYPSTKGLQRNSQAKPCTKSRLADF